MFLFLGNKTVFAEMMCSQKCYHNSVEHSVNFEVDSVKCGKFIFDFIKGTLLNIENNVQKLYKYDQVFFDDIEKVLFLLNIVEKKVYVLNICLGKELLEMPFDVTLFSGFYKLENRYFVKLMCDKCENYELWEFEFDLERLELTDSTIEDLSCEKLLSPLKR